MVTPCKVSITLCELRVRSQLSIIQSPPAQNESGKGSAARFEKAYGYTTAWTPEGTLQESQAQRDLKKIESILFPNGAKSQKDKNDVQILFEAKRNHN